MTTATVDPAQGDDQGVGQPKKGERYRCPKCAMALEITADCPCDAACPAHFHCCGREMVRA
jgi:hypothetical protein